MDNNSKVVITREQVKEFTKKACEDNGLSISFFESFWDRLSKRDDIFKEYVYYLVKRDFLSEVEILGYHVIDIMIWQMDHFKAKLDMDTFKEKHNEAVMIMEAFDTFLKMAESPEEYRLRMQTDTGVDGTERYIGLHQSARKNV